MRTKLFLTIAIGVVMSVISGYSIADDGSISGRIAVQLVIGKGCEVIGATSSLISGNDFGTMNFGEQSSLSATLDADSNISGGGKLKLKCTDKTPYTITLNNGNNATGNQRRLSNGGGLAGIGAQYVAYNLYTDSARSNEWPQAGFTNTGDGTEIDLAVYGRIPSQATPGSGLYTDTVRMTVTW